MEGFYYSVQSGDQKMLCLAPLTDRRIAQSGQMVPDPSGYFLFEQRGEGEQTEVEIIAQAVSAEAVERLRDLLGML
jgi:hypothetical protein